MKQYFLLGLMMITGLLHAQEDGFTGVSLFTDTVEGNLNSYVLSSIFGQSVVSVDDETLHIKDYKGSPLLLPRWTEADVLFNDGVTQHLPLVNYDALSDQFIVYLKNLEKDIDGVVSKKFPLIALNKKSIISVELSNKNGRKKFVRVNAVRFQKKPKTEFFEYFSSHPKKAYVLKSYYKKIMQNYLNGMPYTASHELYAFRTYTHYYIRNKYKVFVSTGLNKKSILKALDDGKQNKTLKKYIKENKLKMSHPEDVQKLLEYYFDELAPKN